MIVPDLSETEINNGARGVVAPEGPRRTKGAAEKMEIASASQGEMAVCAYSSPLVYECTLTFKCSHVVVGPGKKADRADDCAWRCSVKFRRVSA